MEESEHYKCNIYKCKTTQIIYIVVNFKHLMLKIVNWWIVSFVVKNIILIFAALLLTNVLIQFKIYNYGEKKLFTAYD